MPTGHSSHPRAPRAPVVAVLASICLALAACGGGCGDETDSDPAVPGLGSTDATRNCGAGEWTGSDGTQQPGMFVDISDEVGLDFQRAIGPLGTYFLPEINLSGGAMFEYDGDGHLDLAVGGSTTENISVL